MEISTHFPTSVSGFFSLYHLETWFPQSFTFKSSLEECSTQSRLLALALSKAAPWGRAAGASAASLAGCPACSADPAPLLPPEGPQGGS